MTFSRKDSNPPEYLSAWTPDPNHFIPVTVLQSPFLIDFDPNLMVFDMDYWAYAVVDNLLQKNNAGRREQGNGEQPGIGIRQKRNAAPAALRPWSLALPSAFSCPHSLLLNRARRTYPL